MHSAARLGEGSHFVATLHMRMLRATHAASGYLRHATVPRLWHNLCPHITRVSHKVWSIEGPKCSQELLHMDI